MAVAGLPQSLPHRAEEAAVRQVQANRGCTGPCCELGFAFPLLSATFGDCLIMAHYKHRVTFARS